MQRLPEVKATVERPMDQQKSMDILKSYILDAVHVRRRKKISQAMRDETLSSNVLDAGGEPHLHINQIRKALTKDGYLIIKNTHTPDLGKLSEIMSQIGFSSKRAFTMGGRASKSTQEKWVQGEQFRRLDKYPAKYYLLPNPEVQYMKFCPQFVSLVCIKDPEAGLGGRTFLHSCKKIGEELSQSALGLSLLDKIRRYGLKIKTGYLNESHPSKSKNYFQSVEERFGVSTRNAFQLIKQKEFIAEYDDAEILYTKGGGSVLMTEINIPGFRQFEGESYLNLPRIALTSPSIENGYREYLFGNNEKFSPEENELLIATYLNSREEVNWKQGDIATFNNITHAHSREKYDGLQDWPICVAMDGVSFSDSLSIDEIQAIIAKYGFSQEQIVPFSHVAPYVPTPGARVFPHASDVTAPKFELPANEVLWAQQLSTRVFDAKGQLATGHPSRLQVAAQIKAEFDKYGYVHITNTGIVQNFDQPLLDALGFTEDKQFGFGGKISGRTTRQPLENSGFRKVDAYPPQLVLLPHNEILYQKVIPKDLMFTYVQCTPPGHGGRTFTHLADEVEKYIGSSALGKRLLTDIKDRGLFIKSAFVDRDHPDAHTCYIRSWQDRFGTDDIKEATAMANNIPDYFDSAWDIEDGKTASGKVCYTLMTTITVPGFNPDILGRQFLMFPRMALTGPAFENGFRVYGLGQSLDGPERELTGPEIELLLNAFLETRHGCHQRPGDILMVENFRVSHSRESFDNTFTRIAGAKLSHAMRTEGFFANSIKKAAGAAAAADTLTETVIGSVRCD